MSLLRFSLLCLGVVCAFTSCTPEKIVQVQYCRTDVDCPSGFLCEGFECIPKNAKTCENVNDGTPILQPSPHTIDFGTTTSNQPQFKRVLLTNIGNCTLTLFESNLLRTDGGMGCELCGSTFPKEIFPGRNLETTLSWTPANTAPMSNEMLILSDDKEYSTFRLPIHGNYIGSPALTAVPSPVDFGFVAVGRQGKRNVTLTNRGTGSAPVTITALAIDPPMNSEFEIVAPMMALPKTLKPITADPNGQLTLELHFTPQMMAAADAGNTLSTLVVSTSEGELRVPLSGNSATPPHIVVTPMMVDLGNVRLGTTLSRPLTISNEGGAPLTVRASWGGTRPSTDLSTTPQLVPSVAPGTFTEMQVVVTATAEGPITGLLVLNTNDPSRPNVTIPVTANGVTGPGPEVVKLEMTFGNGQDGTFDNDIRDVDMALEHPFGYVCNKRTPNPTNWAAYGTPTWLAFPPKEEPERIVLADARTDGTYRVMVSYAQDCASVPTALLAGILGISIDALIDYLSGGIINIPGQDVGSILERVCLDHSSSAVNVKVFVNGMLISEKNTTLGAKGDSAYVLDLVRANGVFSVH